MQPTEESRADATLVTVDAPPDAPPSVAVDLVVFDRMNFAMAASGVPVVPDARVRNTGSVSITGSQLEIGLSPDLGEATVIQIPPLRPGEVWQRAPLAVNLPNDRLREVRESEPAALRWLVRHEGRVLTEGRSDVRLLAFNEWPGIAAPAGLLAAFVTPNQPAVAMVLRSTREILRAETGDDSITGYQVSGVSGARSSKRVLEQVRALHAAIQQIGISYLGVPASFEAVGQKIRLPDQLLAEKMGNCLDVTVLAAACLEQMGLAPLLVIVDSHAFPGVWLEDDRFPEGILDDVARFRNQIELRRILAFDSSTTVTGDRPPLEAAVAAANALLSDDDAFDHVVDVRVERKARWLPLPLRVRAIEPASIGGDGSQAGTTPPAVFAGELDAMVASANDAARGDRAMAAETQVEPHPLDPLAKRVKKWRERLLDLSLRNRLLNTRLDRGVIPLRVPDVPAFENALSGDVDFEVLPEPEAEALDQRDASLVAAAVDPVTAKAEHDRLLSDLAARRLHASLQPDLLIGVAKKLARQARTDLEEGGSNTLFAVVGMLKWRESEVSDASRFAPLLLIPIRLEYEPQRDRVRLRRGDEDAIGNVTLVEKLKADFHLDVRFLEDPPADDQGIDVSQVFRRVREAIQGMSGWEVVSEVVVGQFTFGKFLMWNDLEENKEAILGNPIVRHIAEGGKTAFPDSVSVPDERTLDAMLPPAELPTVVDADSTQLKAVLAALRGRSFVLQGPPGTGKSQTITNLIAAALARGKSVLFVSEKMAALDVVHRRLKATGLEDFCLELHSHKANKKQVLESLGRAFHRATATRAEGFDENAGRVERMRAQLNDYVLALHIERPIGTSFYRASARALALRGAPRIAIEMPAVSTLSALTRDRLREMQDAATALVAYASRVEPVLDHPWRDSGVEGWSGALESRVRQALDDARERSRNLRDRIDAFELATGVAGLGKGSGVQAIEAIEAIDVIEANGAAAAQLVDGPFSAAALGDEWTGLAAQGEAQYASLAKDEADRADLAKRWKTEVFGLGVELAALKSQFDRHAGSLAILRFFTLRAPNRRLAPLTTNGLPLPATIATDLGTILAAVARVAPLARESEMLAPSLCLAGSPAAVDSRTLRGALDRVRRTRDALARIEPSARAVLVARATGPADARLAAGKAGRDLVAAVAALREALRVVADTIRVPSLLAPAVAESLDRVDRELERRLDAMPRFRDFAQYGGACAAASSHGIGGAVAAHRRGDVRAAELPAAVERSVLERWIDAVRDAEPALRDFDGSAHAARIDDFRDHDAAHQTLSRAKVLSALDATRPKGLAGAADSSEPGQLLRELKKKRRHLPLRKLFQSIPGLLPRLKPCFLMSPLSVAQYLPPSAKRFDLVVFDEASQIGTHDAIGAIARGDQVVIVGDSKQLPPTAFFSRAIGDEEIHDDADIEDLESVLDEAIAARMPEQSLGWHYRSRHESLIRFSNRHYYDDQLNVFPAARGRVGDLGIKWHRVEDGVYEFGQSRTNPREARVLVDWLVAELRRTAAGDRSFGVVTFSAAQQTLVLDLLDEARRAFPEIEPHFSDDRSEPVFVKNLENVQGDERDEILFSICYGPDAARKVRMNFGPLNLAGGERRLNVAITRARCLLRVFSTLTHDDIDPMKARANGARHLREFLRFAKEEGTPSIVPAAATVQEHDSEFERQVFDALSLLGFTVDAQVGCGGYRIDLGVRHPKDAGVYVLGVECDGAPYHSGATARDRDRLRQSVLAGLGWRLHRVWSTDWWFDREREVAKLESAVRAAIASSVEAASCRLSGSDDSVPEVAGAKPSESPATASDSPAPPVPTNPAPTPPPPATSRALPPLEPYAAASLSSVSDDPDDLFDPRHRRSLRDRILLVVRVEAPIHRDVVAKAVSAAFGVKRMTERFRVAIHEEIARLGAENQLRLADEFVWRAGDDLAGWSRMRGADGEGEWRSIDVIAIEELAVAARWHLERSFSMQLRDLLRETARTFGTQRIGKDVEKRLSEVIDRIVASGRARRIEDRVEWVGQAE